MATPNDCRRRQVLASLVPVKAREIRHDISLTDYGAHSVFTPRQNQTPDGNTRQLEQSARRGEVSDSAQPTAGPIDAKKVIYSDIEHVQQQWVVHQQERFDLLLQSSPAVTPPRPSTAQQFTPEFRSSSYSTPLRQLDHIERLFQTAVESLPTSTGGTDYLVASQCYAMALEQLTVLTKSLQDQKEQGFATK